MCCVNTLSHSIKSRVDGNVSLGSLAIWSLAKYEGSFQKWVVQTKQKNPLEISNSCRTWLRDLSEHMSENLTESFDVVVPIPSHPLRVLWECDLSLLWASEISRALKIPIDTRVLKYHSVWKKPQKLLTQSERISQKRFRIGKVPQRAKKILLVDDVMTTGSSLEEAQKLLHSQHLECKQAIVLATVAKH